MKAAVVFDLTEGPVWADFIDPQPAPGQTIVDVRAAALSHVVRARASGRYYSFDGNLPFVPGIDGVGTTPQGRRVYFAFPIVPFGSIAQQAPVALQSCLPVPDALGDVSAAAMANPGMSVWASLVTRAQIQAGETVPVNDATGNAGQLAVQIARHLEVKKIIATGRNAQTLTALDADECIHLTADDETLNGQFSIASAAQIGVVIDYPWGHSAEMLLLALAKYTPAGRPVRYVQVGSLAGVDIVLSGTVLRSASLVLMGSGIGSLLMPQLLAATGEMLQVAVPGRFTIVTIPRPLQEVATAWLRDDSQKRTVFTLG